MPSSARTAAIAAIAASIVGACGAEAPAAATAAGAAASGARKALEGALQGGDARDLAEGMALGGAVSEVQTAVLWTLDEAGAPRSHWIRGNSYGTEILGTRDGLIVPVGAALWSIERSDTDLPLCDCTAFEEAGEEPPCPAATERASGAAPLLVDLVSGDAVSPLPLPETEGDDGPLYADLDLGFEALGSVGPYLFLVFGERWLSCGAAHGGRSSSFAVVDLSSGEVVDLLSEGEAARVDAEERALAAETMADDPAVDVAGPDDVDLAAAIPRWVAGAGLQLEYRFTAESSHAASDDTWSSYTRSVVVPARALPEALVPFAALPPVAAGLGPLDPDVRIGGWALVSAPPVEAGAMLEAFLGEPGSGG